MTELTDAQIIVKYKEEQLKRYTYSVKRRIWSELMIVKAEAAELTVSDAEVLAELKTRKTKIS